MANRQDNRTPDAQHHIATDARLTAMALSLRRINREVNRLARRLAGATGLHVTDIQALDAIVDAPVPLTPGRLGRQLGLTSGSVTACLDRLEKAGHVKRVRETADRRVVHLYCEPTAREAAADHSRFLVQATRRAMELVGEGDGLAALRFLDLLDQELTVGGGPSDASRRLPGE
ncbi:MarR family winged helix-turn-helix transcriptional regulator [Streptomyces sp. NPDC026665]|uniref:MarR family winged helix-turn-helix transcriptional regulator n=1 Tax=Streptomyces sp. NPDC026665 TaxID=3154798 RepID=UPI0033CBE926